MNAMIPMYVYTSNFITDRVDAIKDHYQDRERGAGLVEYAGLIVLAVIILAAIYAAFKATGVQQTLTTKIASIFKGKSIG